MNVDDQSVGCFPLTPALSPRERENCPPSLVGRKVKAAAEGFVRRVGRDRKP
jgi:hypothetical protein